MSRLDRSRWPLLRTVRWMTLAALPLVAGLDCAGASDGSHAGSGGDQGGDNAGASESDESGGGGGRLNRGGNSGAGDKGGNSGVAGNGASNGSSSGGRSGNGAGDGSGGKSGGDSSSGGDGGGDNPGAAGAAGSMGSSSGGASGGDPGTPPASGMGPKGTVPDVPCSNQVDHVAPSVNPPGGLTPDKVPMFVVLGFDDNGYADGINWVLDNFAKRVNPDGTAALATFFISAGFDSEFFHGGDHQTKEDLLASWKRMKANGHEIANHTWSHSDTLAGKDAAGWLAEIKKANDLFVNVLGVEQCKVGGFRTPFLNFGQATFDALKMFKPPYDASVEFGYDWWTIPGNDAGFPPGGVESGKHYFWPFTMDQAFPNGFASKGIGTSPGIWEFPVYTFNKISGTTAATVTGLDYNLWNKNQTDAGFAFVDVLKESLDQRLAGNRSPFAVGAHTDIYAQYNPDNDTAWPAFNYMQRRKAMNDFLDYAQTKPEVRLVSFRQLLDWLRHPKPL